MDNELKFSPLPIEAIKDRDLGKNALQVLAALHYRNGDLGCFPSRADLCELTGLFPQKVSAAIAQLREAGWLEKEGNRFILKDTKTVTSHQNGESPKRLPKSHQNGSQKSPNRLAKDTKTVTRNRTKENSNRKIKEHVDYPPWLNLELWKAWKQTRQTGKTKYTKHAEQLGINTLVKLCPDGINHEAFINQSIERGWKTFYPLKQNGGSFEDQRKARNKKLFEDFLNES